ncbi:MAG: dolichol-phosphate mannosyltransferase [Planctomycetota bacterium]
METDSLELSMIVPCYNEEQVLGHTLRQLIDAFAASGFRTEFICVDNGSSDRTGEIIQEFIDAGDPVVPTRVEVNIGYGNGVLQAIPLCQGSWIGIIPADGQVDAEDVVKLFSALRGTKGRCLGKVRRRFRLDGLKRKIISVAYNMFVFMLWPNLGTIDVNGSPKIVPADAMRKMKLHSKQWFLDPELMVKAQKLGIKVLEVNVFAQMRSGGTSHVRMGTCWEFFSKLLKLRFGGAIRKWHGELEQESKDPKSE